MSSKNIIELQQIFRDLINYESKDPLEPIDPISYRTPEGDSCLHYAAMRGDLHAAVLLLDAGLSINEAGDMGNTPLHYASEWNHEALVKLLLDRGADREISNEFGHKPLSKSKI